MATYIVTGLSVQLPSATAGPLSTWLPVTVRLSPAYMKTMPALLVVVFETNAMRWIAPVPEL